MQSEEIDELATALAVAQGAIENPLKNKKVKVKTRSGAEYEFEYADLNAILDAIKKPLSDNGLSYIQFVEEIDGKFRQVTQLMHTSGQWIRSAYPLFMAQEKDRDGNVLPPSSQGFGSAQTFMRRYALCAMTGVAADADDDANAADGNEAKVSNSKLNTLKRPVADAKPLSDPQVEELMLYAAELETERLTKFLAWLNVKSLDDIKAHQYERAMAGLRKAVGRTLGDNEAAAIPDRPPEAVRE